MSLNPLSLRLLVLALWPAAHSLAMADAAFTPGEVWRDTDGQPINAHGGGLLFHGGAYYWHGEAKTGRTCVPETN